MVQVPVCPLSIRPVLIDIHVCVCVFDIYNSFDPYAVRFDHKGIRQHLTVCPEICHFSRFPVFTKGHEGHGKHCSCC